MKKRASGFTLVELLVVMGLIATLLSLLIPVVGKVRSAAHGAACMSNLRQLGQGWTMYTTENKGQLLPYVWSTPATPNEAWLGYWPGALERYKVQGRVFLSPWPTSLPMLRSAKGMAAPPRPGQESLAPVAGGETESRDLPRGKLRLQPVHDVRQWTGRDEHSHKGDGRARCG